MEEIEIGLYVENVCLSYLFDLRPPMRVDDTFSPVQCRAPYFQGSPNTLYFNFPQCKQFHITIETESYNVMGFLAAQNAICMPNDM